MRKNAIAELIAQILNELNYTFVIQLDNNLVLDNNNTKIVKKKKNQKQVLNEITTFGRMRVLNLLHYNLVNLKRL